MTAQPPGGTSGPAKDDVEEESLRLDYEKTLEVFTMLADIRFKLLAFVPTLAGVAIALLSDKVDSATSLAVAILGLAMTLGILIYEVRNSQIYDAAIHRAKFLERELRLPLSTVDSNRGGLFNERPKSGMKLFGVMKIWHDRGLSLAYGAALGGWAFVIADSASDLLGRQDAVLASILAVITGSLFAWQIEDLSKKDRPRPLLVEADISKKPPSSDNLTLADRCPAPPDKQLAAAFIASGAVIVPTSLFYLVLMYIGRVSFIVTKLFTTREFSSLPLSDVIIFSAMFGFIVCIVFIILCIVFLIAANRRPRPGLFFARFCWIIAIASCYLPLRMPTSSVPMATKLSLAGIHLLGVALLATLLIGIGLPYPKRADSNRVCVWRFEVKPNRFVNLKEFIYTLWLPAFEDRACCLEAKFNFEKIDDDKTDCTLTSYWDNPEALRRFKSSLSYQEALRKIKDAKILEDEPELKEFASTKEFQDSQANSHQG